MGVCIRIRSGADDNHGNSAGDGAGDGNGDDDGDGDGTKSTSSSRLASSTSMSKHQQTEAFYWPKLPQTQNSIGPKIPLEMLLLPKLSSLKRGSEAGSEAGSEVGSQSDSQSGSQAGSLPGSQAGSQAATHNTLNECVSTCDDYQQSRLAEVCRLPAVYSPIVPHADVHEPTMDGYRLRVEQGSTGRLLSAARVRVRVAQSIVDLHFC